MLFGKSFDYWADVLAVMKTRMIQTPEELEKRLSPGVSFSTEMVNRIKRAILSSIGDVRWCPNCQKGFVPDDRVSNDARVLYHALFMSGIDNAPLTDKFQEWNW